VKIGEVCNRKLVKLEGEKSVLEACKVMGKKRIGSVLVTLKGKPYGIFTERDLLSRVLAEGVDPKKAKLKDYSSAPLITVDENYSVKECARIMSDMGVRRLLVTSSGKLVGIFTSSDLTRVLSRAPLDF
jgi:CBS domain-containing protein